ncbi:ubiquitin-activating E1 FCCH domain-containing protein [Mesorhizobium mediterraneum]|uniref:ubiquitin-activating E1 FCCH domain-containing protein n=1 Tax=Mesorhizobium mediterraneum TaxID=43617 RepID=UPI001AEED599|nr:ubiquitin-activating E1 FCCH domain-containing protein [Mesorhizobium mediterraneum]
MKTPITNRRSFLKVAPIAAFATGAPLALAADATADDSDALAELGAGYASDAVNVPTYATKTGMSVLAVPAGISALRVDGFSAAGDGGAALYKRVVSRPSHAGKVQSLDGAWWELAEPTINVQMLGAVCDGVTNDATSFAAAVDVALLLNASLELPAGRDINIANAVSFEIAFGKQLRIFSNGGARLLINGRGPGVNFYGTTVATGLMLTSAVAWGDRTVTISSASGIQNGDLVYLDTDTEVESSYGYDKQTLGVVGLISGNNISLVEPSNFDFATAETSISAYRSGKLILQGVSWKCTVGNKLDFTNLRAPYFCDATIEGTSAQGEPDGIDCLMVNKCEGVLGERLRLLNSRYTINVSNASANSTFRDIYAEGCRHPVDANFWARNTLVQRLEGLNNVASVECHPSFETKFEDVREMMLPGQAASSVGLRCLGGHAKRVKATDPTGALVAGGGGVLLLPAYRHLGQLYDRVYEDVESLHGGLGATNVRGMYVRRCKVPTIDADARTSFIGFVEVDDQSAATANIRRTVQRTAPRAEPIVLTPTDEWGARGTVISITGITKANPGIVTAPSHGRSNGDVVRIDGVAGMTQVNKLTFTVANAATDTFELSGINTSAYTAYLSGGKIAPGVTMKTTCVKQVPYIGWSPTLHYKAVLRSSGAHAGATTITIPFKLKHNYGSQEIGNEYRQLELTLRAFSRNRGMVVIRYPLFIFQGNASVLMLGAGIDLGSTGTLKAVINNSAPHFFSQIAPEGGDASLDYDQFYITADAVMTLTSSTDILDLVELEVIERRMGV